MPAQRSSESHQDYETPHTFVHAVESLLHIHRYGVGFAVDLAATQANSKGLRFISPEDDSLSVDWLKFVGTHDSWCWLNPPFKRIGPWVEKCDEGCERGLRIAVLLPAAVGTHWFHKHVANKAFVLALRPRLTFVGQRDPYPKDLMLCLYDGPRHGFNTWDWRA